MLPGHEQGRPSYSEGRHCTQRKSRESIGWRPVHCEKSVNSLLFCPHFMNLSITLYVLKNGFCIIWELNVMDW